MKIPDRWKSYQPLGQRIRGTRFIPLKVPLKENYNCSLPEASKFTPQMLLEQCPELKMIVDLTYTDKFYDRREFLDRGVDYLKIRTPGRLIPASKYIRQFFSCVDAFFSFSEDPDSLIGVHCTHGLNRTAYFVCCYMIHRLGMAPQDALDAFEEARGHKVERENYVKKLLKQGMVTNAAPPGLPSRYDQQPAPDDLPPPNRHTYFESDPGQRNQGRFRGHGMPGHYSQPPPHFSSHQQGSSFPDRNGRGYGGPPAGRPIVENWRQRDSEPPVRNPREPPGNEQRGYNCSRRHGDILKVAPSNKHYRFPDQVGGPQRSNFCSNEFPALNWGQCASSDSINPGRLGHSNLAYAMRHGTSHSAYPGREVPSDPVNPARQVPSNPVNPGRLVLSNPVNPGRKGTSNSVYPERQVPSNPVNPGRQVPSNPVNPGREGTSSSVYPGKQVPSNPVNPGRQVPSNPVNPGREGTSSSVQPMGRQEMASAKHADHLRKMQQRRGRNTAKRRLAPSNVGQTNSSSARKERSQTGAGV